MSAKEKATELVDKYRVVLMNKDTDCGNEILCTQISIEMSIITVNEIIRSNPHSNPLTTEVYSTIKFWQDVKNELRKINK